jgi:AraC-like DNA-binding protein
VRLELTAADTAEMLDRLAAAIGGSLHVDGDGTSLACPDGLGRGTFRRTDLRGGLALSVSDLELREEVRVSSALAGSRCEFGFCVAGEAMVALSGHGEPLGLGAGRVCLSTGRGSRVLATYPARRRLVWVEVELAPETLAGLAGDRLDGLPSDLAGWVAGTDEAPDARLLPTPVGAGIALHQILGCRFAGPTRAIYLEAKAIELLGLALDQATDHEAQAPRRPVALTADDIERLHAARAILERDLDRPPTLLGLARAVGLNDHKLKAGFRRLFGTTVFGYLHRQRMERARELLDGRRLSVAEVAAMVGYANPSHFAAAFRRAYGVPPRSYLGDRSRATA